MRSLKTDIEESKYRQRHLKVELKNFLEVLDGKIDLIWSCGGQKLHHFFTRFTTLDQKEQTVSGQHTKLSPAARDSSPRREGEGTGAVLTASLPLSPRHLV